MHKKTAVITILLSIAILLCACNTNLLQYAHTPDTDHSSINPSETETYTPISNPADTFASEETILESTVPTEPIHSPLYIEGLDVEDVILYFNEVCLDAEFVHSGNATLLQKWTDPIYFKINGNPTEKDLLVLNAFTEWLNTIDGFPGIYETHVIDNANLSIHFCTQDELLSLMGDHLANVDGAVNFWYRNNAIFDATICYRTDLDQVVRNSVILEEIYNGLGPIQDTQLRPDSIIYSEYSEPQQLTEVDELILKLLYHPQLKCGMDATQCETVIRTLYY